MPLLARGRPTQDSSASRGRGREITVGCRVVVLNGRHFSAFGAGDEGIVLRIDTEAQNCDVQFAGKVQPIPVALRHLRAVAAPLEAPSAGSTDVVGAICTEPIAAVGYAGATETAVDTSCSPLRAGDSVGIDQEQSVGAWSALASLVRGAEDEDSSTAYGGTPNVKVDEGLGLRPDVGNVSEVTKTEWALYSHGLAAALSRGNEVARQEILLFLEAQGHQVPADHNVKTITAPFEFNTRRPDNELERTTVEISVARKGDLFQVAYASRSWPFAEANGGCPQQLLGANCVHMQPAPQQLPLTPPLSPHGGGAGLLGLVANGCHVPPSSWTNPLQEPLAFPASSTPPAPQPIALAQSSTPPAQQPMTFAPNTTPPALHPLGFPPNGTPPAPQPIAFPSSGTLPAQQPLAFPLNGTLPAQQLVIPNACEEQLVVPGSDARRGCLSLGHGAHTPAPPPLPPGWAGLPPGCDPSCGGPVGVADLGNTHSSQSAAMQTAAWRAARLEALESRLANVEEEHRAEVTSLRHALEECVRAIGTCARAIDAMCFDENGAAAILGGSGATASSSSSAMAPRQGSANGRQVIGVDNFGEWERAAAALHDAADLGVRALNSGASGLSSNGPVGSSCSACGSRPSSAPRLHSRSSSCAGLRRSCGASTAPSPPFAAEAVGGSCGCNGSGCEAQMQLQLQLQQQQLRARSGSPGGGPRRFLVAAPSDGVGQQLQQQLQLQQHQQQQQQQLSCCASASRLSTSASAVERSSSRGGTPRVTQPPPHPMQQAQAMKPLGVIPPAGPLGCSGAAPPGHQGGPCVAAHPPDGNMSLGFGGGAAMQAPFPTAAWGQCSVAAPAGATPVQHGFGQPACGSGLLPSLAPPGSLMGHMGGLTVGAQPPLLAQGGGHPPGPGGSSLAPAGTIHGGRAGQFGCPEQYGQAPNNFFNGFAQGELGSMAAPIGPPGGMGVVPPWAMAAPAGNPGLPMLPQPLGGLM